MLRKFGPALIIIAVCILTSSADTERSYDDPQLGRWFGDPQRWAESPVGKALKERALMGAAGEGGQFASHGPGHEQHEHGEWNRRIQESLRRLTDDNAKTRLASLLPSMSGPVTRKPLSGVRPPMACTSVDIHHGTKTVSEGRGRKAAAAPPARDAEALVA